ncbi:MAG: hypothetical protein NXY57DRAFT_452488 [Lentinula lateritia]|uniref:DUF6534 domain-containing protein n=1 Tax=Lentinula lateritia TaxID=40482 RepID=A0ABQ8V9R4_9AGAR|nr:MAG: hypothetical protein NXY57DRAFT_452488 [Lentinula lateritia]KAJ4475810.1 hypothetical protein C8R41DRAFT_542093 [Lentinula lateritia]
MAVEITIDNSLGALFIGLIIASVLNGVTFSQTWFYFSAQTRDRSDPIWLKLTVMTVVFLDFMHQLFTSQWIYYYCVTNFSNAAALNTIPWSYYGMAMPMGLNTIIVQTFYVWRVWKLSKRLILPGILWSVCLTQFGLLLYYVYRVSGLTSAAEFSTVMGPYAIATNGTGTAADIFIAAAMVYLLQQARTSIKRTNNVLRAVTIFSVTTGIVTGVCAIFVLSMASAYPGTNIEVTFYFILARLYANSFLATLNVRDHMRDRSHSGGVITTSDFQVHPRTNNSAMQLTNVSHELDNFPRQKTQIDDNSHGELETVISVKVDRITDRNYQ